MASGRAGVLNKNRELTLEVLTMNKFSIFLCLMLIALVGCDSTDEAHDSLTVSPSAATLQNVNDVVTLTVGPSLGGTTTNVVSAVSTTGGLRDLSLPLTWSVVNPDLGQIVAASGRQAVYARTALPGINVVTVRDQYNAEGIATITQLVQTPDGEAGTLVLVASAPNATIENGQNTTTITVSSQGSSPYQWSVQDANMGQIVGTGNSSTETYQSSQPGDNLVTVVDAEGRVGTITITQE